MKLDEKVVSHYESSSSPVDKEGYLFKKGEIKTSYQKRWCVLKGNLLFYKERPTDRDLTGVIVLEGCTVQLCESEEQFAFSLVWSEPGLRTYKFAAEDQDSQESWIKALLSANHSYLALLVMDLEKKYRDALAEFPSEPAKPFVMPSFTAEAGFPAASCLSGQTSTLSSFPAQGAGAGPGPMLQAPTVSSRTASKRSPKLWPKRSANVVPVNTPAPPLGEWSGVSFSSQEDFSKLHDDYGKEVKELIADWSRRGRGVDVVQEENLIDFG
ncbi:sesquipedalian-1-like [Acanthopagrus latus]|uniref:sesquipedalian-1-like n=1 Tax=Acanthopagrus latus TaxID=8177 RepID=UPI00187C7783|nr:sesquipedalian-1-like [Acanthopagrus latus]XP_036936936.1 sesquipedalian-1-like [Acanthopagrus latus]